MDVYLCEYDVSTTIHLIDIPSFDNSVEHNTDALGEISAWFTVTYFTEVNFGGIIYLHSIHRCPYARRICAKCRNAQSSLRILCSRMLFNLRPAGSKLT